MAANDRQVAGAHYKSGIQHWDWVADNELDYFQGQITKYVARCKKKNGLEDLLKAQHFLDKYIELWKEGKVADATVFVKGVGMEAKAELTSTGPLYHVVLNGVNLFSSPHFDQASEYFQRHYRLNRNVKLFYGDVEMSVDMGKEPGPGYVNQD